MPGPLSANCRRSGRLLSDTDDGELAWMHLVLRAVLWTGSAPGEASAPDMARVPRRERERIGTCAAQRGRLRLSVLPIQRSVCQEQGAEAMRSLAE